MEAAPEQIPEQIPEPVPFEKLKKGHAYIQFYPGKRGERAFFVELMGTQIVPQRPQIQAKMLYSSYNPNSYSWEDYNTDMIFYKISDYEQLAKRYPGFYTNPQLHESRINFVKRSKRWEKVGPAVAAWYSAHHDDKSASHGKMDSAHHDDKSAAHDKTDSAQNPLPNSDVKTGGSRRRHRRFRRSRHRRFTQRRHGSK